MFYIRHQHLLLLVLSRLVLAYFVPGSHPFDFKIATSGAKMRPPRNDKSGRFCGKTEQFPERSIWEPLNKSSAALSGSFAPTYRFENLEIHKVFLRFPNLNLEQNPSLTTLAIESEVPLKNDAERHRAKNNRIKQKTVVFQIKTSRFCVIARPQRGRGNL